MSSASAPPSGAAADADSAAAATPAAAAAAPPSAAADADAPAAAPPSAAAAGKAPPSKKGAAAPAATPAAPLVKVLMLHGYTQNRDVMEKNCEKFKTKVSKVASQITFLSAPHVLPEEAREEGKEVLKDPRAWYSYHETDPRIVPASFSETTSIFGWDVSRRAIADAWREQGPFDIVLGFSQGAVALQILLTELELAGRAASGAPAARVGGAGVPHAPTAESAAAEPVSPSMSAPPPWYTDPAFAALVDHPPRGAIFVCGFSSPTAVAALLPGAPPLALPRTRTLHISATGDKFVTPEKHRSLRDFFVGPQYHEFAKPHSMPQNAGDMEVIVKFINESCKR